MSWILWAHHHYVTVMGHSLQWRCSLREARGCESVCVEVVDVTRERREVITERILFTRTLW
jgi:hypothetical protein